MKRVEPVAAVPMPEMPEAPTRLVAETLYGTLGDVLGKVFGAKTSFAVAPAPPDQDPVAAADANGDGKAAAGDTTDGDGDGADANAKKRKAEEAAAAAEAAEASLTNAEAEIEGRERLMNLGEEVHKLLPDLTSVEDDSPVGGGRATREPTVDRTALKAEVDSVFVAARAAESTWKRYTEAHARAVGGATRAKTAAARAETARAELAGAKLAKEAMNNGAVDLDPSLRATVQGEIDEKIARASDLVAKLQAELSEASSIETEARGQAATAGRAFKPPFEEVRKRALRLRLAAEERAERQIGRALSRAERDVQNKAAKLKDLRAVTTAAAAEAGGGGGGENGEGEGRAKTPKEKQLTELERRLEIAQAGMKTIRDAAEGAKTAIEWSKQAISSLERSSKAS